MVSERRLPDIYPTAMNNHGDILCTIRNSGGVDAIWRNGVLTLVPYHPDAAICDWTDIADDGTIVGYCYGGALDRRAAQLRSLMASISTSHRRTSLVRGSTP